MFTAATASGRKTRKAGAPTPTPATFINSNIEGNNTTAVRLQRLNVLCGIGGGRAELIAFLAWGEAA